MIAVLDTGTANAASVLYSLERLGYAAQLTQDPEKIFQSPSVILPGVGTAAALMEKLKMTELQDCLLKLTQPVLGICLGMQALFDYSEEGGVSCLGIFSGHVRRLLPFPDLPIPHMGWNQVLNEGNSRLLRGIPNKSFFYFVHSYRVPETPEATAFVEYSEKFPVVVESSNWFGTQFHPERSGKNGEILLKNFLNLE